MERKQDKAFKIWTIVFLSLSLLLMILMQISYFTDSSSFFTALVGLPLFCYNLSAIIVCIVLIIKKILAYEKKKKAAFFKLVLGSTVVTVLALYFSKLNIQEIRIANAVGLSTLSAPLQISIIFVLLFIIGGIVAGTLCKIFDEVLYWGMSLIPICFGGMLGVMIAVDFASYNNASEIFYIYYAALPLCWIVFCWTAWATIKIKQSEKAKRITTIKIALCAVTICIILFLPVTHGLTRIGQSYRYNDVPRIYAGASDVEQMHVFLKQNPGGKNNAEILGWDIENPTTWNGVVFGGGDIVSIDLKGRGIGGKMEIIYFDKLISLNVSDNPALYELDCSYNQIETLDVSGNTGLRILNCGGNKLKTIDISDNTNLERFSCRGNLLTSLDVTKNTKLEELYCYDNMIAELDLSNNNELKTLYCGGNPIKSIDASGHEKLFLLNCDDSENLSAIDVSGCSALKYIQCWNTKLKAKNIEGVRNNISLLIDYNRGYVAYAKSPEKQIMIIAIILAVHVITDVVAIIVSKKRI